MDEDADMSNRTWNRDISKVKKIGYVDGVEDGQSSVTQKSFEVGYSQGLSFGLKLGMKKALCMHQQRPSNIERLMNDPRKINCIICLNDLELKLSNDQLKTKQQAKNMEMLERDKE